MLRGDCVRVLGAVMGLVFGGTAVAGPYVVEGIAAGDPRIVGWASGVVELVRGPVDIANPGGAVASFGSAANALGPADGTMGVVSLGDGGWITLTFDWPIMDGPGADFAVFENGFWSGGRLFAELGFVEVSSDGEHFVRFPAVSLTPTGVQVGGFGTLDPTDLYNLAGAHPAMVGTPFDLAELRGVWPWLDVERVRYVRVVDVVGRITPVGEWQPSIDSLGNVINDPYPTPFGSGGFDLDAVAVLHYAPEPGAMVMMGVGMLLVGVRGRRKERRLLGWGMMVGAAMLAGRAEAVVVVDLEDLELGLDSYYNGSDGAGGFVSRGVHFSNSFVDWGGGWVSWSGFAYSNVNDTSTPGYVNQYAAITGTGRGGGGIYAVAYNWMPGDAVISLPVATRVWSVAVTNTTYAALSMRDGDAFAKKFGGVSGDDPDWFLLTIIGKDAAGNVTGSVEVYLADFRFDDPQEDYILWEWRVVDLSGLGEGVKRLEFALSSSDTGPWGMNTPAYFALDDLVVEAVPEPGAGATMMVVGAAAMLKRRRGAPAHKARG